MNKGEHLENKIENFYLKNFFHEEHKPYDTGNDTDVENDFCCNTQPDCEYYTEEDFKVGMRGFSLIHFNSRSLYSNFSKIKDYLYTFEEKFSVIAFSETWISEKKLLDNY